MVLDIHVVSRKIIYIVRLSLSSLSPWRPSSIDGNLSAGQGVVIFCEVDTLDPVIIKNQTMSEARSSSLSQGNVLAEYYVRSDSCPAWNPALASGFRSEV